MNANVLRTALKSWEERKFHRNVLLNCWKEIAAGKNLAAVVRIYDMGAVSYRTCY